MSIHVQTSPIHGSAWWRRKRVDGRLNERFFGAGELLKHNLVLDLLERERRVLPTVKGVQKQLLVKKP